MLGSEACQPIAGVVDLTTPGPSQCPPDKAAVRGEQLTPLPVADSGRQLRRRHDVGEEHGDHSPARAAGPGVHGGYSLLTASGLTVNGVDGPTTHRIRLRWLRYCGHG